MEDYIIYAVVAIVVVLFIRKFINKNAGCGCSGGNTGSKCSKK